MVIMIVLSVLLSPATQTGRAFEGASSHKCRKKGRSEAECNRKARGGVVE